MARNQNRMALIRKVHGMIDNQDLEKHRHSQDQVGALLGSSKERAIQSVKIGEMDGEWVSVNRVQKICNFVLPWRRIFYRKQSVCKNINHQAC